MGRQSGREQALRIWRVYCALRASRCGLTLGQLAREFGVTERTIRQDLADIEEIKFGLPVSFPGRDELGDVANAPRRWRIVPLVAGRGALDGLQAEDGDDERTGH